MKKLTTLFLKDPTDLSRVINIVDENNKWVFTDGIPTRKFDGTACAIIDGELYKRYDAKLKKGKPLKALGYYNELLEVKQFVVKVNNKKFSDNKLISSILELNVTNPHNPSDNLCAKISTGDIISMNQLRPINISIPSEYYKQPPINSIPCQEPDLISGSYPHWAKCNRDDNNDRLHFEAFDNLDDKIDGTYELCGERVLKNSENITGHQLIKHGCEVLELIDFSFDGIRQFLIDTDIEGIVFHHKRYNKMCKIRKSDFGIKRI
tara:strand:+ start:589 stop:1380 length:792 start_codon:yes stop_codon:yes gene_type:complete